MRINLRKIVQNIREAHERGAAQVGGPKSAGTSYPFNVAREYLPDATFEQIMAIAKGKATLRWMGNKVEYVEGPTVILNDAGVPAAQRITGLEYDGYGNYTLAVGPDDLERGRVVVDPGKAVAAPFTKPEPEEFAREILIRIAFKGIEPAKIDYFDAHMHLAKLECTSSVDRDGLAAMLKGMEVPGRGMIIAVESYATLRLPNGAPLGLLIRERK